MKLRRLVLTAGLAGALAMGLPMTAMANVTLPFPGCSQDQNQWCWVAATQITVEYLTGAEHSQCQYHAWGKDASECPNEPGSFSTEMTRAMEAGGLAASGRVTNGTVSFATIRAESDAGRPLLVRAGWKATDKKTAHVLPLRGYTEEGGRSLVRYLHIYTAPTVSQFRQNDHSFMVENSDWGWTHNRHEIGA